MLLNLGLLWPLHFDLFIAACVRFSFGLRVLLAEDQITFEPFLSAIFLPKDGVAPQAFVIVICQLHGPELVLKLIELPDVAQWRTRSRLRD